MIGNGFVLILTLFSLSIVELKSSDFSRPRLNNGIFVGAPDDWRWCRDGIHISHIKLLKGEPDFKGPRINIEGSLYTIGYNNEILNTCHKLSFDKNGYLRFSSWYDGLKIDNTIPKPITKIKSGLRVAWPRKVPISWLGESKIGYMINVQILHEGKGWSDQLNYYTKNNIIIHNHTGANKGRWKVRSLSEKGASPWSEYVTFTCSI